MAGQAGQAVALGDHLPLLGDLHLPLERAEGLGQHRLVGRSPAPADRAPPAVEQPQQDPVALDHVAQAALGPLDLPLRRGDAGVLVGVGVPQHHLLDVAPQGHQPPVGRVGQQLVEDVARPPQLLHRLQQGDEADPGQAGAHVDQARLPGQDGRGQHVVGPAGHGDDVALHDLVAVAVEGLADGAEGGHGGGGTVGQDGGGGDQRSPAGELPGEHLHALGTRAGARRGRAGPPAGRTGRPGPRGAWPRAPARPWWPG